MQTSANPDGVAADPRRAATVIAHRGASGYRPEHTLAGYELAVRQGADLIEPDVVVTRDGVLVVRHENEIGGTTDVAQHPEFAARRTTKVVDGQLVSGWFTEDFTLAELRTLRAVERLPVIRPENVRFDGLHPIPTLAEVFQLALDTGVGVAPELKYPTYYRHLGLAVEPALVAELERAGLNRPGAPVLVQSFEVGNLMRLRRLTPVPLLQLVASAGAPYDLYSAGMPAGYAELATPTGLAAIASYADAVGFAKEVMIPRDLDGRLAAPTTAVADAHHAGLAVVGWTFRRENTFLPVEFRSSGNLAAPGDLPGELAAFLDLGMDAFFVDHPDVARAVVDRPQRGSRDRYAASAAL